VTWRRVAALAGAIALSAATKYSVLLFVPILAVLALVAIQAPLKRRLAVVAGTAVAVVATTWLVLWACYGFRFASSPDPSVVLEWDRVLPPQGLMRAAAMTAADHHLLPEALLYGFLRFYKASESRPSFLLGSLSREGFWYYFPVTFALKTPLPLLLLLAAAVLLALRGREDPRREVFLWLPPLLYMALVMTRSLNIGHRHLLPLYPYLFILGGRAAAQGLGHASRAVSTGVALVLLWYAGGTLANHPHHLAFFNELAGGPRNGYRRLVDSNLDWGQDLPALKRWVDANGVTNLKLAYFGSADPDYYGIHGERLPGHLRPPHLAQRIHAGDVVAISATHLQGLYLEDRARELMQRFAAEAPVGRAGRSILIYRAREEYDVPQEAGPSDN